MNVLPLLDRAGFDAALEDLGDVPLTLALIDLDHFKTLNDALGHAAGDNVLRSVERLLTGSLPAGSLVAHVGGDEYAAALPDTPAETALIVLSEVIRHFQQADNRDAAWPASLGMSVGLAYRPAHAQTLPDLMRAADAALYRAKVEGRGRACIYVESRMVLKSNYYPKASLERLSKLSAALGRTEASLLREALDNVAEKYRGEL
ncbi:GGDEF domain-containing protein [Deinococcus sp.]|uniref:GGDEF domain-containing protein n=1 Tax=Deinococcus sp. TaxID=47478 RepID=UPI003CC60231